ncbi:MAG: hypothetical protein ACJAZC_003089 [Cryomorphaceae bacterium]|jgi:hypothetical protein
MVKRKSVIGNLTRAHANLKTEVWVIELPLLAMATYLVMWFMLHPFHVGLTDINYNSDSKSYQVSIKLFTDDLEKGLEKFSGLSLDIVDSEITSKIDSLISRYTNDHFQLFSKTEIDLNYIGSEREYDVTWIYLESDEVDPYPSLSVKNDILFSMFSDQTHIVHYTIGKEIQSDLIHAGKTKVLFQH